jgi:cell division protein FtsL
MDIIGILNLLIVGVFPLIYKLIKDINALIIKIETQKTEIKNLKDDIRQLSECLHDLKLKFIK